MSLYIESIAQLAFWIFQSFPVSDCPCDRPIAGQGYFAVLWRFRNRFPLIDTFLQWF